MLSSFKPKWVLNEADGLSTAGTKKFINGKKDKKEEEDNGKIKEISRKVRSINRAKKRKKRGALLPEFITSKIQVFAFYFSFGRKAFINKIIREL